MKSSDVREITSIAATFIGTVIGAGFASGQEIRQFYSAYGNAGSIGIVIAVFLMGLTGVKVFQVAGRLRPKSYYEFLQWLIGSWAPLIDLTLFVFLLILTGVMFAGCGAVFATLGWGYWIGIIVTGILALVALFYELSGLELVNILVVPLMFIGCLGIAVYTLFNGHGSDVISSPGGNWFLATLQFSSYNLILSFPVLLAMGQKYRYRKTVGPGIWVGCIGLGVMAGFIHWSILTVSGIGESVLPMVVLAQKVGPLAYWYFAVILWGEMFTTLLADIYGITQRLSVYTGWTWKWSVLAVVLTGIVVAQAGFANSIARCYPLFGYICLILMLLIVVKKIPLVQSETSKHRAGK